MDLKILLPAFICSIELLQLYMQLHLWEICMFQHKLYLVPVPEEGKDAWVLELL